MVNIVPFANADAVRRSACGVVNLSQN